MRLRTKIVLYFTLISVVLISIGTGYIANRSYRLAEERAIASANAIAAEKAQTLVAEFNTQVGVVRSLSQMLEMYGSMPIDEVQTIYANMMKNVLASNKNYLAVWVSWEMGVVSRGWDKPFGRVKLTCFNEAGLAQNTIQNLDINGIESDDIYYDIKVSRKETVTDVIISPYSGTLGQILQTSIISPLSERAQFAGIAGIDLSLTPYHLLVQEIKPWEEAEMLLVSNNGLIVSSSGNEFIGQSFAQLYTNEEAQYNASGKIQKGVPFGHWISVPQDAYMTYAPVNIGNGISPWSLVMVIPRSKLMLEVWIYILITIVIAIFSIGLVALATWFVTGRLIKPIQQANQILQQLDKGIIEETRTIKIQTNDELADMAAYINRLTSGLKKTANFAKQIGQGNLESELQMLSEEDELGSALVEMQNSLRSAKQETEKRNVEEDKRSWANIGYAQFGETLRMDNNDTAKLTYNIIKHLVTYLNANQGGLFIINDDNTDDVFIEMVACHAYDRQRLMQKRIELGVSLIGRVIKERETIHMTEVPDHYLNITSGLGDATPRSLLIVPLLLNDQILGAVEIASFNVFESYQIEFVKKVGESIASSISNVKISRRTNQLLQASKKQSEELAAKEELMRVNMEEFRAMQEDASRKQEELSSVLQTISENTSIVYFDLEGKIIDANDSSLVSIGFSTQNIIGRYHSDFSPESVENPLAYQEFWNELRRGKRQQKLIKIETATKDFWIQQTYTPIYNADGTPYKIISIGIDVTDTKELELRVNELEQKFKEEENT